MSESKPNVPKLRFPGFTDPWEQRKLGEVAKIKAGMSPSSFLDGGYLYVKVNDLNHSERTVTETENLVDLNSACSLVEPGDVVFPKRGAAIATNKVRIMGSSGYIDTNMMALAPVGVTSDYLFLIISAASLWTIADTSTIPQINNKHIAPFPVRVPSLPEQRAIGSFFRELDDLIALHQRKLDHLKLQKRGLLQKMFPKNGANVPEARFPGFTDPWEQRKLGEVATFGGGHTPPMNDRQNYEGGNIPWVTSQDVKGHYLESTTTAITEKGASELTLFPQGAILMVTRSGILRHTLPVAELRKRATVNQDIRVILPSGSLMGEWLLQFFIAHGTDVLRKYGKTGTTVESIDFQGIKHMPIPLPSIEEQCLIGAFFRDLDDLIALHQRKLDHLKLQKKALLQQMFV